MVNSEPLTHMTIFPEQSEIRDVAKLLLALADHPNDVMTTMDPTIGFRIPAWLYETFVATWDAQFANVEVVATEPDLEEVAHVEVVASESDSEEVKPVPRKPGRPRKEVK